MVLYVCEDPRDMLIKVTAPHMDYWKLVSLVAAAMENEIPSSNVEMFSFKDVLMYASLGASFGGDHYPAGFRLKGIVIVCGHEAAMDCSLTTEGLRLKAWLQTFELGPLKVGGDVQIPGKLGSFALFDMELSLERQAFVLNGFVELFDLRAAVDVHVEILPNPTFFFFLELQWSNLLHIKAKAEMTNKANINNPKSAEWTVSAELEQNIISEIAKSLSTALEAVHKAAKAKLDSAKASVDEAEKKYKAAIEEAQKALDARKEMYKKENDELDHKMDMLESDTAAGKAERQKKLDREKIRETKDVQEARGSRDRKLEEKRVDVSNNEGRLNDEVANGQNENNNAVSEREQKKQAFMSKFGDAEAAIERARSEVHRADGKYSVVFSMREYV